MAKNNTTDKTAKKTSSRSANSASGKKVGKGSRKGLWFAVIGGASLVIIIILAIVIPILNRPVPYFEENNISIVQPFPLKVHVIPYTSNAEGDVYDIGAKFDESSASVSFSNYRVQDDDGTKSDVSEDGVKDEGKGDVKDEERVIISFDANYEVPIKFDNSDANPSETFYYSFRLVWPFIADYYSGESFNDNSYSINYPNPENSKELKYTDVSWGGKNYRIGVRTVMDETWDGTEEIADNIYTDTYHATVTTYISAPKGFDGLVIGVYKPGITPELFEIKQGEAKRKRVLRKQADETGEKSEELLALEEKSNRLHKALESTVLEDKVYSPDDFYFFRVSDVSPAK